MHATLQRYLLDQDRRSKRPARNTSSAAQPEKRSGSVVLCAQCSARITESSARIEVAGRHQHTFFNPAGLVYTVLCFAGAPGCRGVGPFSEEFSWFEGRRWQIIVCGSCLEHLGWQFDGEGAFVALIQDRIREADDG